MSVRIISQDLQTCQKLISIYLNMNVSETIVVYLICSHCPNVRVRLILGFFLQTKAGRKGPE